MADLTKLVFHSAYPAFKNTRVYEGSFTLTGNVSGGQNIRTHTVSLDRAPDICDVMFNGPGYWSAPADAWFKEGYVTVNANYSGFIISTTWFLSYKISGTSLIITAIFPQQFVDSGTLTDTDINYRIVDYVGVGTDSDSGQIAFDSRLNYLKRTLTGTTSLTLPSAGTAIFHEVNHNLGYVPFFSVGANLVGEDVIWSTNYVFEATESGNPGGLNPPQLRYWSTADTLTIGLANGFSGGEESGDRDVYWAIYLDYSE